MSGTEKSIASLSPQERRRLLVRLLSERTGDGSYSYPLSKGQHALWFVDQIAPNNPLYNNASAIRIKGDLDVSLLRRTFQILTDRHPTLRSIFVTQGSGPVQRVQKHLDVCFEVTDAANCSWEDLYQRIVAEASLPFDLQRGPVLRVNLYAESPRQHVLLINLHHIVMDFWSMSILAQEMVTIYQAEKLGVPAPLLPLEAQYRDYVEWQARLLASAEGEQLEAYWLNRMGGASPVLNLPADRPRPAVQTDAGAMHTFKIDEELNSALKAIAKEEGATLFVVLLAALQILLHRYSGQDDIVVGSPVTGRSSPTFEPIVGYFVNAVPLRADLSQNLTFREFLMQVRGGVLDALRNQDYPFPVLVEQLRPARDLSYPAIFQVMFNLLQPRRFQEGSAQQLFLGGAGVRLSLGELELQSLDLEQPLAMFDLMVTALEWEQVLTVKWQYNTDIFAAKTVARMAAHFQTLLKGIVANPGLAISQLPLLSEAERKQLLLEWNDSQVDFPLHLSFTQLFEAQVERTPDATAAVSREETLSYEQLNRRVNRLARILTVQGVGPDMPVAILADRSTNLLTAIVAVFKAGGAYIPLDPLHPSRRISQMLEVSGVGLILVTSELAEFVSDVLRELPAERRPVVLVIDELLQQEQPEDNLPCRHLPENLAYVIYTSGSTGLPKGVMVQHVGMLNHLFAKIATLDLSAKDKIAQTASQCFDIAVWQFLSAPLVGGSVHIFDNETALDPSLLLASLEREEITILETVPSLLRAMLQRIATLDAAHPVFSKLRWLISTGEALPPELCHWTASYPKVQLLNAYGPTECSDDVTHYRVEQPPTEAMVHVPIGLPIANMQLYILDAFLQPQPIGVAGELFIGGIGVGRGYLNDPAQTAESFIPDPFAESGKRLYRSGDLARYLPDGNIEFLGRLDFQVKVRGLRIELQEIEVALAQHPDIYESTVISRKDLPENSHLIAYIVANIDRQPTVQQLRSFLKETLPAYMVPSGFVFMESLPRTTNGKVERQALPMPETLRAGLQNEFVAPRTDDEEKLAAIWAELLNLERVGVEDNFFELGGHSVLAIHLVSHVRQAFGVELPLLTMFEEPTVAGLARVIESIGKGAVNAAARDTTSNLRADAVLSPEIVPGMTPEFVTQPADVFLTGATGFLGAHLLDELLNETDARIHCLVRAPNFAEGMQRIEESLRQYSLWDEAISKRIVPVIGDLSKPLLGLSETEFQSLGSNIDVIYHNGAAVNFVFPYSALKAANVSGTQEVLRLACVNKAKHVNYISSLAVFPLSSEFADSAILEADCPDSPNGLRGGYARSKWVAEQLVLAARSRGLSVSIFRPGLISGHSQTGISNPGDFICRMVQGCIGLGSVPDVNTNVEMAPVDYVSRAIIYLSRRKDLQRQVFHLANPRPAHWRVLVDSVIAAGYELERVSYDEWQARLLALGSLLAGNTLFPFLPFFSGTSSDAAAYTGQELSGLSVPSYDCRNALAGLEGSGIACPPVDSKLFGIYLSHFVANGFLFDPGSRPAAVPLD
ncbi:MAG TPA: amino acid adenylation domain-containing protein [Pyrinomonadaceae bacterium]|jgi:amino acid adenylation domain-containing protein/thioester reductase-like protein|nr:amino acid adenylation domain-containing protein [Pyrinomonadaceae bacterium]